jgi:hypothetical protein
MLTIQITPAGAAQLVCLIGMMGALCWVAHRHQAFTPFREAALGLTLYLTPALTLWWSLLYAYARESTDGRSVETWPCLVLFALSLAFFLGMCARAFHRNEYRWYREPLISVGFLVILWLIIFPIYGGTHCRSRDFTSSLRSESDVRVHGDGLAAR